MTYVYVPPPQTTSVRREDPKCPHCHEPLKGWYEPSDMTGTEILVVAVVILTTIVLIFGAFAGFVEGDFDKCEPFGAKRYHYLMLTYVPGCVASRWLSNKKAIFEDSNEQR
jgi:hypothetical protein